jgi:putative membrane protein insertion efficiency factor
MLGEHPRHGYIVGVVSLDQFVRKALRVLFAAPVFVYQKLISPMLPSSCIYQPTCSHYAIGSIMKHGVLRGMLMSVTRILRCAGGLFEGGLDPVPEVFSFRQIGNDYRRFWRTRRKNR